MRSRLPNLILDNFRLGFYYFTNKQLLTQHRGKPQRDREREVYIFTDHSDLKISNSTCRAQKLWKTGWILKENSKESVCTHGKTPLLKSSPSRTLLCDDSSYLWVRLRLNYPLFQDAYGTWANRMLLYCHVCSQTSKHLQITKID